jgi:hypothetical protein
MLQIDGGFVEGYNVDHHLLREEAEDTFDRFSMEWLPQEDREVLRQERLLPVM